MLADERCGQADCRSGADGDGRRRQDPLDGEAGEVGSWRTWCGNSNDGNYVLLTIDADGVLIAELERRLRVSER